MSSGRPRGPVQSALGDVADLRSERDPSHRTLVDVATARLRRPTRYLPMLWNGVSHPVVAGP